MTTKAYVYTRMSSPEQLRGDSLRRQMGAAATFARDRELEIVAIADQGISAFRGANAQLGKLAGFREELQRGKIARGSYFLVESLDRLSREDIITAFQLLSEIVSAGIVVVTLQDGREYSKDSLAKEPLSIFIPLISFATAGEESRKKSERLSAVWGEKKRQGRVTGRPITKIVPSWLALSDDRACIVQIPERAALVKEVFDLTIAGWGAASIARLLNERQEPLWNPEKNKTKAWHESYIKKLLCNRAVLGEYLPHSNTYDSAGRKFREPEGDPIHDYYPAIIDPLTFDDARDAAAKRRLVGAGRKGSSYANLFTGLLRCHCGAGIRYLDKGAGPKGGQYLTCASALLKAECRAKRSRYAVMEEYLLRKLEGLDVAAAMGLEAAESKLADLSISLNAANTAHALALKKQEKLLALITSDAEIVPKIVMAEFGKLETALEEQQREIKDLTGRIETLKKVDPTAQRELLDRLIAQMRVSDTQSEDRQKSRRALAAQIQKIVKKITLVEESMNIYDPDSKQRSPDEDDWEITGYGTVLKVRVIYHSGMVQELDRENDKDLRFIASKQDAFMRAARSQG